jgi:copper(I)-binding protein
MNLFRRARAPLGDQPEAAASRSYTLGEIEIGSPWARASSSSERQDGAGFFTVNNKGTAYDRLIAASSPAAERIEIHAIKVVGPDLRMREREGGLALPPGVTLTLKPRGYHLLLIGLRTPLQVGALLPVSLTFEEAGTLNVELVIASPGPIGLEALQE